MKLFIQFALFSLVKKMDIDHPYHTIFQVPIVTTTFPVDRSCSDGRKYGQLTKSGMMICDKMLMGSLWIICCCIVLWLESVLEWVDGTLPIGEYLIRSRNGGAHGRYGLGDWSFLRCREHMTNEKDKRKAFHGVSENFRLDWFGK
nr:serine/threonine-protein kinase atm [Quercus suber]